MKAIWKIALLALSVLLIVSCASTGVSQSKYDNVQNYVMNGKSQEAVNALVALKEEYKENDAVLYFLDAGMLYFYNGDLDIALDMFTKAEEYFKVYRAASVTEETGALLTNDYARAYKGESYEDVYINGLKSLIYYMKGDVEGAMVEVRKADTKITDYALNAKKEGDWLEKLVLVFTKNPFKYLPESMAKDFTESAFMDYISMLLYRASGDEGNAEVDFNRLSSKLSAKSGAFSAEDVVVPSGKARLNVIAMGGLIAEKEEMAALAVDSDVAHKISWPMITGDGQSKISQVIVKLSNKQSFQLEKLESFTDTAKQVAALDTKANYLRSYYRGYMKSLAAVKAATAARDEALSLAKNARKAGNVLSEIAYKAAEKTANAAYTSAINAVKESEVADTRMGKFLPDKVSAGGITCEPGVYDIEVEYHLNGGGTVRKSYPKVAVKAGELNLLVTSCGS